MKWSLKSIADGFRRRRDTSSYTLIQQPTDAPIRRISPIEALKCPPVAVAIRVISQSIGELDWHSDDTRANEALMRPNGFQTKSTFIAAVVRSLLLHGKAPVQRDLPAGSASMRMFMALHDPERLRLHEQSTAFRPIWAIGEQTFAPEDLRVLFDGGSQDPEVQTRIDACSDSIRILNQANRRIYNHLVNVAEGRVVFVAQTKNQDELTKEQKRLVKRLAPQRDDEEDDDYQARTYGGILVAGLGADIKHIPAMTPADQELLELRESALREISASIGIPPFSTGGDSDTKFNNFSARQAIFVGETQRPIVGILREGLSELLEADVKCPLNGVPADAASRVSAAVQAAGGAVLTPEQSIQLFFEGDFEMPDGADVLRSAELSDEQANARPDRRGENQAPALSLVTEE